VISDKPLTEDEWIRERGATVIEGEAVEVAPRPIEDKTWDQSSGARGQKGGLPPESAGIA
jgi:hypothetical protein